MTLPVPNENRALVAFLSFLFFATLLAVALGRPATAAATVTCDRVAAPSGSDSNPGTLEQPFLTAQRMLNSLAQGQTGCLRAGTYSQNQEIKLSVPSLTLTSFPGERATLKGRLWVADAAPGSVVADLNLDGRNDRGLPSPTINGDHVTLRGNDITNHHTEICVSIGSAHTWGRAQSTLIEDNRIHDCGRMPATNFDHGIYVNSADDTVIRSNWIYDNADRGIQIYPDAQRTLITGNVIDGNGQGVIFGGSEETASSNSIVEHNVITNSRIRDNVESSWGGPIGTGNIARDNCVGGGAYDEGDGGILQGNASTLGFVARDNLIEVPPFANEAADDFTIPASHPCAALISGDEAVAEEDPLRPEKPESEPKEVTIDTGRDSVHKLVPVRVRGRARGARRVTISFKNNGRWHRVGSDRVRTDGSYRTKVRLSRSGRQTLKASAGGFKDSDPVRVRVKR